MKTIVDKKNGGTRMAKAAYEKFFRIDIYWSDEDAAWIAVCPDLPGCMTHGDTEEEALAHAKEARALYLESLEDRGINKLRELAKKKYSGKIPLRIAPDLHRDLAIRAKLSNKSLNEYLMERLKRSV